MSFGRLGALGRGFGRLGSGGKVRTVVPGIITASGGSFLFTGSDAILLAQRKIAANSGSFSFTGSDASLLASAKTVAANAGAFLFSGDTMTPLQDYKIPASSGSFSFTGADATLTKTSSTTTFDPSDVSTNIVLSGGNLIGTATAFVAGIAHSVASRSSGKYYCEFIPANRVGSTAIGVMSAGHSVNDFLGNATNTAAVGYGSAWQGNIGGTTTADILVVGHVHALAVDVDNRTAWVKDITAAGNWNANGSADPATNTNGCTLGSTMASGDLVAAVSVNDTADSIAVNFGATSYVGTPPSGFGNW